MTTRPVCLITGASAGIGAACAELAARQGYDLLLHYRSDDAGIAEVQATCTAAGAKVVVVKGDVALPEDVTALYATLDNAFGRLDALINNAGIVGPKARLTDMDHTRLTHMFAVNVVGAMLVARDAVTRMEAQGTGGAIVNLSSAAARLGSGNQYVDYAASKAAIDTFTKGLSDEVAAQNIRVNAIRPGIIETEIHAKGGEPDRAARMASAVPMQRSGSAMEVAQAILWLLSSDASYVTGTTLDVSGGR